MATCAGRDIWCTAGRGAAVAVVLQEAAIGQTVDSHAMDGALSPFHIIVKGRVAEWTSARSSRSRLGGSRWGQSRGRPESLEFSFRGESALQTLGLRRDGSKGGQRPNVTTS